MKRALASNLVLAVAVLALYRCDAPPKRCAPSGHWRAEERRDGGDCLPGRVQSGIAVVEVTQLDMTDQGSMWRFDLSRDGVAMQSCSGTNRSDRCELEIMCYGDLDEARVDYVLELTLTDSGALSGSSELTLTSAEGADKCNAIFDLEGELASPLELETRRLR